MWACLESCEVAPASVLVATATILSRLNISNDHNQIQDKLFSASSTLTAMHSQLKTLMQDKSMVIRTDDPVSMQHIKSTAYLVQVRLYVVDGVCINYVYVDCVR